MDIEGYEWSVAQELVRKPHLLPESISLELVWTGMFWVLCFAMASYRAAPFLDLGIEVPLLNLRI